MKGRIEDKILEINEFLDELSSIIPLDYESYKTDFKLRAASERYFEKIISAVVDLAFFVIKEKNLKQPEEDKQAFDILVDGKIISENLSGRLKDAKGMRNVLAHEYGRIDNELVFHSLAEELIPDVQEFLDLVEKILDD